MKASGRVWGAGGVVVGGRELPWLSGKLIKMFGRGKMGRVKS